MNDNCHPDGILLPSGRTGGGLERELEEVNKLVHVYRSRHGRLDR